MATSHSELTESVQDMEGCATVGVETGAFFVPVLAKLTVLLGDGYQELPAEIRSDIELLKSNLEVVQYFLLSLWNDPKNLLSPWGEYFLQNPTEVRELSNDMMDEIDGFIHGMERVGNSPGLIQPETNISPFEGLRDKVRLLINRFCDDDELWNSFVETVKGWPAATVATGALDPVLAKLTTLLGDGYKLEKETRSNIKLIISELEPVHSLLLRMWERTDLDAECNDWMTEARKLSYTVNDDIYHFMSHCMKRAGDGPVLTQLERSMNPFGQLVNDVQHLVNQCFEKWRIILETMKRVTVATGAFGPVLAKLTALLTLSKYSNVPEIERNRSDMEFIESELWPVFFLLLRLWERVDVELACKEWMIQARRLSYKMADIMDAFLFSLERGDMLLQRTNTCPFEELKVQVDELVKQCREEWETNLEATISSRSNPTVDPPSSFPHKGASELAVMDREKTELTKLVQQYEVVCIHGFAGMGKTTLADLVFQERENMFECQAFVSVSARPNIIQILTTLISEVIASAIVKAFNGNRIVTDTEPLAAGISAADHEESLHKAISELLAGMSESPDDPGVTDNTMKNSIGSISKLLVDKSGGETHGGAHGVADKQNLINIITEVLEDKRNGSSSVSASLASTSDTEERHLANILRKFLVDKRYLVIVDDICDWKHWKVIESSLPKNFPGSIIITTTRVNAIAEEYRMDNCAFVYEYAGLSMDAATALSKKIFMDCCKVQTVPSDMLSLCSSIAKMSGGMPLAVICVSVAVAEKLALVQGELHYPGASSRNRFDVALSQALENFLYIPCMKPLAESIGNHYHSLPLHLKTCLLHCSIYPSNVRFEKDDLTRIWIAEGFANNKEQAQSYFDELVNWGYIRLAECRRAKVLEYGINAMMLAFLRCQQQEYDFVDSVGFSSNVESLYGRGFSRLSVQGVLSSWDVSRLDFSCTRSLVSFGRASLVPFERLNHLRVLHLDENSNPVDTNRVLHLDEDSNPEDKNLWNNYPDLGDDNLVDICELLSLRYLRLEGCNITELRPEIGKLNLLENLDVRSAGVRMLPREIGELHLLQTLNISNTAVTHVPKEIGALEQLETLDVSKTKVTTVPKEIEKLQQLKTLNVSNTHVKELPHEIGSLEQLETLDVSNTNVTKLMEIERLQKLKTLDVSGTDIDELPEQIWKLKHLKTVNISKTKVRMLPWEASQLSNSVHVLAGDIDSPEAVQFLATDSKFADIFLEKRLSIMISDPFGLSLEPIPTARYMIPGMHASVPDWLKNDSRSLIRSLEISLLEFKDGALKILQGMPNLQALALRIELPPTKSIAITKEGFQKLERWLVDCRGPPVIFQEDAMPKLKHVEFKFYACRATEEYSMGITLLQSLQVVVFRSTSWYNCNARGISAIINKVCEEAKQHHNRITLCVNDKVLFPEKCSGSCGENGFNGIGEFRHQENNNIIHGAGSNRATREITEENSITHGAGSSGASVVDTCPASSNVLTRSEMLYRVAMTRAAAGQTRSVSSRKPKGNYPSRRVK